MSGVEVAKVAVDELVVGVAVAETADAGYPTTTRAVDVLGEPPGPVTRIWERNVEVMNEGLGVSKAELMMDPSPG